MVGDVRKVYPPEGKNHIMVRGNDITSQGVPLKITKELMALSKAHLIRIDDSGTDQPLAPPPQPQPPTPTPTPTPTPAPDTSLDIDTPEAAPALAADQARNAKLAEVEKMTNEQLRDYVESIGQDSHGKRRGSLPSLAREHVKNLPADQL